MSNSRATPHSGNASSGHHGGYNHLAAEPQPAASRFPGLGILRSRLIWMTLGTAVFAGAATVAATSLLRIPGLPNCPSIFWPTASATLRIYCAELAAERNTERDLRRAIALVGALPDDHPMRAELDRMIEEWSFELLELAEETFHQGDLERALSIARRISRKWPAHAQVDEKTSAWRDIWATAERLFQETESALRQEEFKLAFALALDLSSVNNRYWQTVKQPQLSRLVEVTRQEGEKLSEARYLARQNSLADLLKAIDLVSEIGEKSYLHAAARRTSNQFWQTALDMGLEALDYGDSQQALAVARRLPDTPEYKARSEDLRELALAVMQAGKDTIPDIENAIIQAKKIRPGRPLHYRADEFIRYWQADIQNLQQLAQAESIAARGGSENLRAAIAQAQLVSNNQPRAGQAQNAIDEWRSEIQRIEDRPLLNQAEDIAAQGDARSLETAIGRAQQISSDSILYDEASSAISRWQRQLDRITDAPLLERSRALAREGSYDEAIALLEGLDPDHGLYDQAQGQLEQWQQQTEGESLLEEALALREAGSPASVADAIQLTRRVPRNSSSWFEANRLGNQWSEDLLNFARQAAGEDLQQAIAIAQLIPSDMAAYDTAQELVTVWQGQ
ncbi:MAG: hypothetical protein ACFB4J_10210 [Elainellaceae cyanobacterium]